jgi:hypothetical protein
MDSVTSTVMKMRGKVSAVVFRAVIYIVAFVTGAIVMSFEMLGSRYLNRYFGSGIYTCVVLISTVLAALQWAISSADSSPIARYRQPSSEWSSAVRPSTSWCCQALPTPYCALFSTP